AVRALTDRGTAVVLASGRMFPGTQGVARALRLPGPVICQQGCSVHLIDGTMTHEFPIERTTALEIIDYARQIDRAYEWFNPLRYIASRQSEATEQYGAVSGITPEYRPDPENSGIEPTGVGIISDASQASLIHRELVQHHGEAVHMLDFPTVTVAVAANANKGHALSLICADLGIERHETIAVGDSVNDASMLTWAGRGYAMSHSDRYALDAADEVLGPSEDEELAELLERIARG
ncbi:MAG TPA: HAD hydrolase family protein, partial [Tepidiformaceae bacterium]|nr:HAD hydrolase family protein [Tepidiformaceae bacterium]